ncbi:MAG: biopolymer transporter ExbD [Byssovorax sp.]
MAMGGGSSKGVKNEINITPLVDVVLVLLIIFMVVTPMLQRGKDVTLPQAKKTDEEHKDSDPIVLSLTQDKKIWVESADYDEAGLEKKIRELLQATPGRRILFKGDNRLTFGDVRHVMDICRKAGARGINLGVEELKAK